MTTEGALVNKAELLISTAHLGTLQRILLNILHAKKATLV